MDTTELQFFNPTPKSGKPRTDFRTGNNRAQFTSSPFAYTTRSRRICVINGKTSVQSGFAFTSEPWNTEVEGEYHKRFSGAIERWLDAGYGSCILRRADSAAIVAETLRHFDGERLALISSVVMGKSCARGVCAKS